MSNEYKITFDTLNTLSNALFFIGNKIIIDHPFWTIALIYGIYKFNSK